MPKIKTEAGKIVDVSPATASHMVEHGYAEMVDDNPKRTRKAAASDDDSGETSTARRTRKKS